MFCSVRYFCSLSLSLEDFCSVWYFWYSLSLSLSVFMAVGCILLLKTKTYRAFTMQKEEEDCSRPKRMNHKDWMAAWHCVSWSYSTISLSGCRANICFCPLSSVLTTLFLCVSLSLCLSLLCLCSFLSFSVSVSQYVCLWACHSLCLSLSVCLSFFCLSLRLFVWLCSVFTLHLCLSVSVSMSLSLSLYPYLCLFVSVSVSLSVCLCLSVPISVCFSFCLARDGTADTKMKGLSAGTQKELSTVLSFKSVQARV